MHVCIPGCFSCVWLNFSIYSFHDAEVRTQNLSTLSLSSFITEWQVSSSRTILKNISNMLQKAQDAQSITTACVDHQSDFCYYRLILPTVNRVLQTLVCDFFYSFISVRVINVGAWNPVIESLSLLHSIRFINIVLFHFQLFWYIALVSGF